jgi:membrane protein required for colicin V production
MTPFDFFLIAIIAYSTIMAFIRGILLELFSIGGLIAGIVLAAWNYPVVAPFLGHIIKAPSTANVVAFLFIVVGVMILCTIAGKILHRTADAIGLGFFDRLLGAAFGFARGCLLGVAIMMAAAAFLPNSTWISNSHLASYFLAGAHAVSFVVPHDLQQQILDGAAQLKHNAPDWIKPHG